MLSLILVCFHGGEIADIIVSDYIFKLLYSIVILFPAALFVTHIKRKYGLVGYSKYFNPFKKPIQEKVTDLNQYRKVRNLFVQPADKLAK